VYVVDLLSNGFLCGSLEEFVFFSLLFLDVSEDLYIGRAKGSAANGENKLFIYKESKSKYCRNFLVAYIFVCLSPSAQAYHEMICIIHTALNETYIKLLRAQPSKYNQTTSGTESICNVFYCSITDITYFY